MSSKNEGRLKRSNRIRRKILAHSDRPRLCVRRSLKHMYAQIVDDSTGKSIAQAGSTGKEILQKMTDKKKVSKLEVSRLVGELIAEKAREKGVDKVVFDRKGYAYHGRVKALAEAARKKGLQF